MAVENASNFLKKYLKISPPNDSIRGVVARVVNESSGFGLEKKNIKYNRGVVYLDITPSAKSKVFLRKKEILSHLERELGDGRVVDIR